MNDMEIRYVERKDKEDWFRLDRHLPEAGFTEKVRTKQGYVLTENGKVVGILRYNLFWDIVPFCTLLYIDEAHRRRGCGKRLMARWEQDMRAAGSGMVMVSTQTDEEAQHFYRKLSYKDAGGFVVDLKGYEQPMELIMIKGV